MYELWALGLATLIALVGCTAIILALSDPPEDRLHADDWRGEGGAR